MVKMQWAHHDELGFGDLPELRGAWSNPKSIEEACVELAQRRNQARPITVVITCCVAEVTQNTAVATITLKKADTAISSSVKLEVPADTLTRLDSSASANISSSTLHQCLALETGTAMVRWMWDDVGLSWILPQYKELARRNPFRWSNWMGLEDAVRDLERYTGTQEAHRPVRLILLPNLMSSFVTKADTATDAWMALRGLLGQNDEQPERIWSSVLREDSFISCPDLISDVDHHLIRGVSPTGGSFVCAEPLALNPRVKVTSRNPNKVSQFRWLHELLEKVSEGAGNGIVRNLDTNQNGTPLFVVAGSCPNNFCGMQAVLFCQIAANVDFWWIKPQATDRNSLEQRTLDLHSTGAFKNTADRSRQLYAPLAEKFACEEREHGSLRYGVDNTGRAYIEEQGASGQNIRMLLYLVWQESWSSLLARQTFIEGKIFYQRCEPAADDVSSSRQGRFFSRQYRIESSNLELAPWQDEEEIPNMFPPDSVQDMYAMTTSTT